MKDDSVESVIKTSVEEFLDLSPVDMQMIELKVKLAQAEGSATVARADPGSVGEDA